ncbi:MAG TPA: SDR family oxidoreductase [Chitinophagaceae bacterium]|nr:SDR family oxidoreductase [Chitinophagaceae bacterium]
MATVLILGATSDIGQAIAVKFAKEGYDLQLAARNTSDISALRSDCALRYSVNCTVHVFDALATASHESFYTSLPVTPDVSILVFGYMDENEAVTANSEKLLNTINVNYTGALSILNIISRDYIKRKKGTIAAISSVAGERGRATNYIYGSAKAGLTAYLSGLRNEAFNHNVHVATILPGFVYTRMTENMKLPPLLTATPELVAESVYNAVAKKKDVIYVKWFWKWIMLIIRSIPEFMFKKMKI